jgi:hypothetical protein
MKILLVGGFQPQIGDVFDLFNWGTVSGTFDLMNLPSLNSGMNGILRRSARMVRWP